MKTVLFAPVLALGIAIPALGSTAAGAPSQPIHLAVVACDFHGAEQAAVMLKSAVLSARSPLAVHVFADDASRARLERSLWAWPERVRQRIRPEFLPLGSPGVTDPEAWSRRFPRCGSQRLFFPDLLPDVDRVLAVDPDALFLRPVDELWRVELAPDQIAAMPQGPQAPTGVLLMDLARMRRTGWRQRMTDLAQTAERWPRGDQELLERFFHDVPEKLHRLSCAWGLRLDFCSLTSGCAPAPGAPEDTVGLVYGGRSDRPTFRALSEAFQAYPFGEDPKTDLLEPLRARFAVADPAEACASAREPVAAALAAQIPRWPAPGERPAGTGVFYDVAAAQLAPWRQRGIVPEDLARASKVGIPTLHYQILGGKLYRAPLCSPARRCPGFEHFLVKVAPLVPDVDFYLNPNDFPNPGAGDPLPLLSFSKLPQTHGDILYPVWAFWHDDPWLGVVPHWRWDEMRRELLAAGDAVPWEQKKPVVFFRGGLTSPKREPYTLYSVTHREQWDVRFTPHPSPKFMARVAELEQEVAEPVPPRDHCAYRYLLNVDGISSTHRLRMMMACGGLLLYVQPEWMEFYYYKLVPWKHFVPLPLDPAQGQRVLDYLVAHDDLARRIAGNGRDFVANVLTLDEVDRYWVDLLREYAALQRFKPQRAEGFVAVEAAND
ncbi:MAG TPA: glycosyl transferase family 90 [Thermoanaerobaculia bacterium]|nr:glycosyl transferase family 90 [Thermoanaerobaculia bacterium]